MSVVACLSDKPIPLFCPFLPPPFFFRFDGSEHRRHVEALHSSPEISTRAAAGLREHNDASHCRRLQPASPTAVVATHAIVVTTPSPLVACSSQFLRPPYYVARDSRSHRHTRSVQPPIASARASMPSSSVQPLSACLWSSESPTTNVTALFSIVSLTSDLRALSGDLPSPQYFRAGSPSSNKLTLPPGRTIGNRSSQRPRSGFATVS